MITFDDDELVPGLDTFLRKQADGAADGLEALARILEPAMQNDPAHGDVTGATHANYGALVFGPGRDPSADVQSMASVVESLNPGHSETQTISVPDGSVGMLLTSATDYQWELEIGYGGNKAVITPTLQGSVDDFTRYAAQGMRDAL